jgi:hypothetical protein
MKGLLEFVTFAGKERLNSIFLNLAVKTLDI